MLLRIVKHEWRNLTADRTLWWVTFILVMAIGYGVHNGTSWVNFLEGAIEDALETDQAKFDRAKAMLNSGEKLPGGPRDPSKAFYAGSGNYARHVFLPPAPLASLSLGQSDMYPSYFVVNTMSMQRRKRNAELENPNHLLESRFDLAFVMVYLFPLLILAVSYDLVSSEREQGTLAMVLSQPISPAKFVAGKVGFRATVVCLLVLVFSILAFLLNGVSLFQEGVTWQLLLWIGIVVAYSAFWFSLAVAVNALGKSSAANAIILASLWLVWVLLLPSAVNLVVTSLYPVPSRVEFVLATRVAALDTEAQKSQVLSGFYQDHPELLTEEEQEEAENFEAWLWASERAIDESVQPVMDRYDQQLLKQQNQVNRLRFLSPALVTQEALNDIAGTGLARYRHFLSGVDDYQLRWRAYFAPKVFQDEKLTAEDYDQFPEYSYVEESESRVTGQVFQALAGLILPTLLIFGVGLAKVRNYPLTG